MKHLDSIDKINRHHNPTRKRMKKKAMTIAEFITELKKTKDSKWYLGWGGGLRCKIEGRICCPITAIHPDHFDAISVNRAHIPYDNVSKWLKNRFQRVRLR